MAMLGRREENTSISHLERVDVADAHTILGPEAKFSGKLSFEGSVRIDGYFEGEISTGDVLVIGPRAEVKAKLEVGTVIVHGTLEGDVTATNSVEIKAPAKVRGNINTPNIMIEQGVLFDGTCKMASESPPIPPLADVN